MKNLMDMASKSSKSGSGVGDKIDIQTMDAGALQSYLDSIGWDDMRTRYIPSLPSRADIVGGGRRDELVSLLGSPQKLLGYVKEAAMSASVERGEETTKSAILTAARKNLPERVLTTLENLPTPKRIVSMSREQVELLLKSVNWDDMIAAGKLPTSFPTISEIMMSTSGPNGIITDVEGGPAATLASLLTPAKLTEIVRSALRVVPGGAAHVKSLEDGINKAKSAAMEAANRAAESTPALALVKRTTRVSTAQSKVEEATRE